MITASILATASQPVLYMALKLLYQITLQKPLSSKTPGWLSTVLSWGKEMPQLAPLSSNMMWLKFEEVYEIIRNKTNRKNVLIASSSSSQEEVAIHTLCPWGTDVWSSSNANVAPSIAASEISSRVTTARGSTYC